MRYIQGQDRNQVSLFPVTLEEAISADNSVRDIDSFVNSLNLQSAQIKGKLREALKAILQRILSLKKPTSKNMVVFKHSFIKNNKLLVAA